MSSVSRRKLQRYPMVWIERNHKGKRRYYTITGFYDDAQSADEAKREHVGRAIKVEIVNMRNGIYNTG